MADDLSPEERKLIDDRRAAARPARKVRVKGKGDDGSEYEFDLEGEEADRVIQRHKGLFAAPADPGKDDKGDGKTRRGLLG